MDFRSRDRYATRWRSWPANRRAQLLLALKSVERARQCTSAPDDRAAHVGYHLIGWDAGTSSAASRGSRISATRAALFFAWATPIYLCSVAGGHGACRRAARSYAYRWLARRRWHSSRSWRSCRPASWSSNCCSASSAR
jgi:hypothetical protein